jgi:GDP-L-fucose synthase
MKLKKILITGADGFLGGHLAERLENLGYSNLVTPTSEEYNLIKRAEIQKMFDDHSPEIIIHLAAVVGGIGANMANPGKFFYENAIMGIELMEEARKRNVDKFVAIGTICAYPKLAPIPFREADLWSGYPEETNAPYGLAKKMMLVQAQAYRKQYGFNAIYLLLVNLYGPRDNFDPESSHVIPAMIRKFKEARSTGTKVVELWGDGSPTREFLYVEDAADGIIKSMERYNGSEPVNIGTGVETTIKELATTIAEHVGYNGVIFWNTDKPNGQPRRCLDVSRARELFGFEAQHSLNEGLQKTISWFREYRENLREVKY